MALLKQTEKFIVISKRVSSFTDDEGKKRSFHYVSGFNPTNDSVYVDLTLAEDEESVPFVGFDFVEENGLYECEYSVKSSKNLANSQIVNRIRLTNKIGHLELKMDKK